MKYLFDLAERAALPDAAIRAGIQYLLRSRLKETNTGDALSACARTESFVRKLRHSPVAIETAAANEQHYEVPAEFFRLVLGHRLKYSSCLFRRPGVSLNDAEDAMLELTCRRAGLRDGMEILELGCGWGSLTLWMAEHFPSSRIHAVSNSHGQREFILERCHARGLRNVRVTTCDVNALQLSERFDRIVSVEMFEHVRNYDMLFQRIASWLKPGGQLFVHIFCHGTAPYEFETQGAHNWLGRHFFTGGIMPSEGLFSQFNRDLCVERTWRVPGVHYGQTAELWLQNMDARRPEVMRVFRRAYGRAHAALWFQRWRIFFMACAELWNFRGGREWYVAHYLLKPRREAESQQMRGNCSPLSMGNTRQAPM